MIKEFKEFAMKGNVLDMAVGIIIGAAFGKIVSSLVADILMPPFGFVIGQLDFSSLFFDLSRKGYHSLAEAKAAGAPTINYGLFLNATINFLIVSFAVFLLVRQVNRFRRPALDAPPARTCPFCCSPVAAAATRCPACTSQITAV